MTRNAVIISLVLLVLLVLSLVWHRLGMTPRVWELNRLLEQDPVLAPYPYDFRVLVFLNGIATLTSPRVSGVPVEPFLKALDPALADLESGDAAFSAADDRFREYELRAIQLMISQPDVDSVVWAPDRAWYHRQGIKLP